MVSNPQLHARLAQVAPLFSIPRTFLSACQALLSVRRAFCHKNLSVYKIFLNGYRALLSGYRALLSGYRALLSGYRALLREYRAQKSPIPP